MPKQSSKNSTKEGANFLPHNIRWQYDLKAFIEEVLYPADHQALEHGWRLGKLHDEWNDLVAFPRLRILAPRDHLKTYFFSTAYPLQRIRFKPMDEIYIFSKTDKQAVKLLDNIKRTVRQTPYLRPLSKGAGVDFWNKTEMRCSNGATIYAQGFWSAVRGAHPKLIILDDVIDSQVVYSDEQNTKSIERFLADILPMAEPDTKIFLIGTLQREDDLYHSLHPEQYILKTYDAIVDEAKKRTLFPEKWSWEKLEERRREISHSFGDKFFLKEYRNVAVNLLGEIIKPDWLQYFDRNEEMPEGIDYTGWDLSVGKKPDKGDWTAVCNFRRDKQGNDWIFNVNRWRIDFPTRLKKIVENYQAYPQTKRIAIEDNTFQSDTVQLLIKETPMPIKGIKTTQNKVEKFNVELAPPFENRKVYIRRDLKEFVQELLALPRGKYDDMADAFCIARSGIVPQGEPRIRWI